MIYRFGDFALDVARRELRRRGVLQSVEPQVLDLLKFLIVNRHRVVSRDEIFKSVWRGRIVSDSVLGSRMHAARRSIGDDGAQQRLIRTMHRNGFRFVGPVSVDSEIPTAGKEHDSEVARQGKLSVAVIPVVSIPADPAFIEICKGWADDFAVALARSRSFGIIAHDRTCADMDEAIVLARDFGAAYLVGCQFRVWGTRFRLLVRVTDLWSGLQIWAYSNTRRLSDGLGESDDVKNHIAAVIEAEFFAAEAAHRHEKRFEEFSAAECVFRALSITRIRSRQNYSDAMRLLARAVAVDPENARAYSVVAFYSALEVLYGWKPRAQTTSLAIQAAQKAAALNEQDPWAHFALGWALTQNRSPEEGIEEYRRAIAINPLFSSAYACLGLALAYVGRTDQAVTALDEGERLAAPEIFVGLAKSARAGVYACAEKYDNAINAARASVRQGPGLVASQRNLVVNCALAGEMNDARTALRTFFEIVPNATLRSIGDAMPYVRDSDLNRTLDAFALMGLH